MKTKSCNKLYQNFLEEMNSEWVKIAESFILNGTVMSTIKFDPPQDSKAVFTIQVPGNYVVNSTFLRGDASFKLSLTDECDHDMVAYNGLTESYNFCKKCDKKDNT
jgi:hypothetical protein